MWVVLAVDVVAGDPSQPIVVALISALGGVIAAAFAALVSLARRENRNPPSDVPSHGERIAVLERRANDTDDFKDVIDRRVDREERRMEDGLRRLRRLEGIDDDHNPPERRD